MRNDHQEDESKCREEVSGRFLPRKAGGHGWPPEAWIAIISREAHPIGAAERRKILATAEGRGGGSFKP